LLALSIQEFLDKDVAAVPTNKWKNQTFIILFIYVQTMDGIDSFVAEIIADLAPFQERLDAQRTKSGCSYLKNPLPLDTTSGGKLVHTQELYHAGSDAEDFFRVIIASLSAAEQDRSVFCCAATSGVGKTRLAYATGKFLTMVLIRVAKQPDPANPFTAPWDALCAKLNPLHERRDQGRGCEEISANALLYVKILICCYVDATVTALEIGKENNLCISRLRELALRFNRNGTGENLVKMLFESKCIEIVHNTDLDEAKTKFRDYRQATNNRFAQVFDTGDEILLVCFDEIQELLNRFPRLFIQKCKFGIEEMVDDKMSRDLFYGVACAMGSFTRNCRNWALYMTGTHLSISKLYAEKGVSSSILRNRIHEFPIKASLMTSRRMKDLLQHYWDISEDTFTESVMDTLDKFRGRPYFFVEGVFPTIYAETCLNPCGLTSMRLISLCNDCLDKVRVNIQRRIEAMFAQNKAIAGAGTGDRTVHSLIPTLIKTIICGNGKMFLHGDQDISQAILDGVILASSDEAVVRSPEKNIRETEPLVYDGLISYLSSMDINKIMNLVLNQINDESGATAEEMFSYWIALKTFSHCTGGNSARKGILLGELLFPLYDGENLAHFPRNHLNEYVCNATKVVNLENSGFVSSLAIVPRIDNSIESMNTETVFFGINTLCGVDIVFVVKSVLNNHYKLVAIQSKNDKSITAKEVLMTLSPGLQYLENPYREFVITGKFPGRKTPAKRSCGPGYLQWDEWSEFCTTYDTSVGNNWIRVALVSRGVFPAIHEYISTEQFLWRYDEKTKSRYWTLFASKASKLNRRERYEMAELANELSPLVFLSLSAKTWLTEELKQRFVNVRPNDAGIKFPLGQKESKFWIPVSVENTRCKLFAWDSNLAAEHITNK
jgi:hypothetical protein